MFAHYTLKKQQNSIFSIGVPTKKRECGSRPCAALTRSRHLGHHINIIAMSTIIIIVVITTVTVTIIITVITIKTVIIAIVITTITIKTVIIAIVITTITSIITTTTCITSVLLVLLLLLLFFHHYNSSRDVQGVGTRFTTPTSIGLLYHLVVRVKFRYVTEDVAWVKEKTFGHT